MLKKSKKNVELHGDSNLELQMQNRQWCLSHTDVEEYWHMDTCKTNLFVPEDTAFISSKSGDNRCSHYGIISMTPKECRQTDR